MSDPRMDMIVESVDRLHTLMITVNNRTVDIQNHVRALEKAEEKESSHWVKLLDPEIGVIVRLGQLEKDNVKQKKIISKLVWLVVGSGFSVITAAIITLFVK